MNQLLANLEDWQCLNDTQTELLTEHFHQAARLSQSIYLSQQRWQVYVNALAVLGFERWLQLRAPDLNLRVEESLIWQPNYANLLSSACNIWVDNFKLCILTSSNLTDENSIPFAVFDVPCFTAHLYVLMQVLEEQQQVAVSGFISYEDYCRYQQTANLKVEQDWTYTIPENWFNSDANGLLLNLRCLSADAIQLPVITSVSLNNHVVKGVGIGEQGVGRKENNNQEIDSVTVLKQKLIKLESQLKNKYPWQLLTVEEGCTLFNSSELIDFAYKAAAPSPLQPLINVSYWLNNQIDAITTELGWVLMPSLKLSAIRSLENFDRIRSGLEQRGVHIPAMARGAYRDLECGNSTNLRLYAITWVLSENSENSEWVLLVALGSQSQASMPETLKLEVRDETELLIEQELKDTSQAILYAQVIGNYGERFYVNVTVNEETLIEIPPFGFKLEIR
ncbi:MAG: DUF1822 family protein [Cyanobacteria bacterium P01_C01_bin.38]